MNVSQDPGALARHYRAVRALTEPGRPWELPRHRTEALSTAAVDAP